MEKINILGGVATLGGDVVPCSDSAAIRLNLEPYHQRIYELEGRLNHIEQAYINSDRLRTEYQLQVEALHEAVKALETTKGRYHTQKAFEALTALCGEQTKTNQP